MKTSALFIWEKMDAGFRNGLRPTENWRAGELESWRAGELESWRAGELEKCLRVDTYCQPSVFIIVTFKTEEQVRWKFLRQIFLSQGEARSRSEAFHRAQPVSALPKPDYRYQ
ncbi:hypothetical protein ZX61_21420 [Vibrio sp. VPAP30]|nr:hypothetical protein ZX61_21420 [Vibrio sp. VPAP30]